MHLTRQALFPVLAPALALVVGGCGGTVGDIPGGAPAAAVASPAAQAAAPDAATPPIAHAVATLTLRDWLDRLAAQHRLRVSVDPALARQPVASALPAHADAESVLNALADFDVLLGYARRGTASPALALVSVAPRGSIAAQRLPTPPQPTPGAPRAQPADAPEADPELAMQRIQQDLASADADVRRAAMVRSFALEAPLPATSLLSALQADAAGDVRLFALMALARHPAVEPAQLRALALAAQGDADAAVRAQAAEVEERLDAAERVFE